MTIDECVDSWTNGNRSTVVDHVISRNSPAEVAYYAAAIACKLEIDLSDLDPHAFLNMISTRIYHHEI